ncbi:hypothetical protein ACH4FX_03130 [Streptomyces sp. NPDC018019]|uniref:hypothetical protein n=1 Tax=Streptomyces sp. NPDC018019 TaxID=3365030 RepID=UPI0037A4EAFC
MTRTFRVTGVWPAPAHTTTAQGSDRARIRATARRWAAAGATATVEEAAAGWSWRHVKTYAPPAPAPKVEPVVVPPPRVEQVVDQDERAMYERLMRQAPTGRDHRGRVACRHVANGRGIR